MEGPPPQYTAKTIDDYLEHLSKGVFQAGISWRVVDATPLRRYAGGMTLSYVLNN